MCGADRIPTLGEVAITPISQMTITKLHQAARGTLAINRIGHNAAPRLIAEEVDEVGDTDNFHVTLAIAGAGALVCQPVAINEGLWIPGAQGGLRFDRATIGRASCREGSRQ